MPAALWKKDAMDVDARQRLVKKVSADLAGQRLQDVWIHIGCRRSARQGGGKKVGGTALAFPAKNV
jgi:hypothetical protein